MALVFIQCCDDLRWLNELLGVSQLFDDGDKKPACRDGQE
jgi:hypothetical protein